MEVHNKILAHHAERIVQKRLLTLASPPCHALTPRVHLLDVAQIALAHQERKHVEKLLFVVPHREQTQRTHIVALRRVRHISRILGRNAAFALQVLRYLRFWNGTHCQSLCTREDGGQNALRTMAHEEKHRLCGRFFEELKELVGTCRVHKLGQPHHYHAPAPLRRRQRQFAHQFVTLISEDLWLLILDAHLLLPEFEVEMRGLFEHLPPLLDPEVAHHARGARSTLRANDREDKVQIGVCPFVRHSTSWASTTSNHYSLLSVSFILWRRKSIILRRKSVLWRLLLRCFTE